MNNFVEYLFRGLRIHYLILDIRIPSEDKVFVNLLVGGGFCDVLRTSIMITRRNQLICGYLGIEKEQFTKRKITLFKKIRNLKIKLYISEFTVRGDHQPSLY